MNDSLKVLRPLAVLVLLCMAAVVFLGKGYESTLPASDTGIYADLSLSATRQGFIPHFPVGLASDGGHWGEKGFNDMPFLFVYLNGWIMRALGPTAFSAKLLSGLFSVGCIGLVVALGSILAFDAPILTGLTAGIILLFTRDFIADGVNSHLDNVMMVPILFSFLFWLRGAWILAAICAGVGMWLKSPVALLLFPTALVFHALRGELKSYFWRIFLGGSLALLLGFSIWLIPGALGHWELVWDYWQRQVYGTAVGGRGGSQPRDWFLFFSILRTRYVVGSIFLLISLFWAGRKKLLLSPTILWPLSGALVVAAVVSMMRFKFGHYFVPAFPFLALLGAQPLVAWGYKFEQKFELLWIVTGVSLITFLLCTPVELAPESFPAVKRFSAIIQSVGNCKDQILFIEGYEPYGSFDDYLHELNFYTGREVISSSCLEASTQALNSQVAWILVAGDNFEKCLPSSVHQKFPQVYQLGIQYLLSRQLAKPGLIDLTPLERELKAVTDCHPVPLPGDRYHAQ